jgi:hypothetical protein
MHYLGFCQAFVANFKEIRSHLSESSLKLAHYADIDWRLDVQVRFVLFLHSLSRLNRFYVFDTYFLPCSVGFASTSQAVCSVVAG